MQLESLLQYLDAYLGVSEHPDYPNALNGLQLGGPDEVYRVALAVDASEATVRAAVEAGVDLLMVHHGLFWGGLQPLTGRHFRRIGPLVQRGIGVYSVHLPLDGHAEVGNAAVLGRALGLDLQGRFGLFQERGVGWWGSFAAPLGPDELRQRLAGVVGGHVHSIPGGPERVERVGVVTGAGAAFVGDAATMGLDALVTGEGPHHAHFDAMELGVHLLFAGHYATETFGLRALGAHLEERFGLGWTFLDLPTGL